jgi:2-polyprenyl-3-methyl-5-hydroxy-6-metoxy-1,4-benzoquinol methylase
MSARIVGSASVESGQPRQRPAAREETACNLCGGRNYVVVGTRDRQRLPLRTVLCRTCGLVWTNPRPSVADMNAYYETTYRLDYKGQRTPPLRKIVRGFLGAASRKRRLVTYLPSTVPHTYDVPFERPRMLDVGSGAGELVYLMRRAGIDATGLEPGTDFAQFARTVLRVPIQSAAVDAADVPDASQDLVTMFHALEHVPDPLAVLTTVRRWVKKGGYLIVEVPNIAASIQAPSHQYHYAHLYHFTASTLAALGERAAWRHVETRSTSDRGNVVCVFRRDEDEARPPAGLENEAERTLRTLISHTRLRHYLSPVPYGRAVSRLRRRLAENRLLSRLTTMDKVLRWADGL